MKPRFFVSSLYLGFFSLLAQTILLREMLAVFSGNEIILGAILAFWLLWVGVGSLAGNWSPSRLSRTPTGLGWSYLLAAFSLLLALFLVRHSHSLWGYLPGETIPFLQTVITAAVSPLPLCFLLGFIFVLNAAFFSERLGSNVTNKIYLLEALGAMVGGVVVTLVLIPQLSNLNIAFLSLSLASAVGLYLAVPGRDVTTVAVTSGFAALSLALLSVGIPTQIDRQSLKKVWRGFSVLESLDSRYGKIVVTQKEDLFSFYENSSLSFYLPNESHAEETIHLPLLQVEQPKNLLLIGGGPGDNLSQALKYAGLGIDYVELDPQLVEAAQRHLSLSPRLLKRVTFHFLDGRLYTKVTTKNYDTVILDLPEPLSAQVNRFYTLEFFKEVKQILKEGAVFSFKIPSSENYISPERAQLLSSLKRTMGLVFEEVSILPGESNVFLGRHEGGKLLEEPAVLLEKLEQAGVETKFVNQNFLYDRLSPFRMEMLESSLATTGARLNTDLKPICYYYGGLLWGSQFKSGGGGILSFFYRLPKGWPWVFIVAVAAIVYCLAILRGDRLGASSKLLVFTVGFASMLVEVVILLSYQTFRGYLYSRVGLLLALFMAGLSLGALVARRYNAAKEGLTRTLLFCQTGFVIYILIVIASFGAIASGTIAAAAIEAILYVFILIAGLFGGAQFVFANNIIMATRKAGSSRSYGTGYGLDLVGSAVGAAFCSAFFVPLLGLQAALALLLVFALICIAALSWGLVTTRRA